MKLLDGNVAESGPLEMQSLDWEAPELCLPDMSFVNLLRKSSNGRIFRVYWQDKDCVLKVYHYADLEQELEGMPLNELDQYGSFNCESRAYCRLKSHGLCERGSIPDFYGVIRDIDPLADTAWKPHLQFFYDKQERPSAVLIEYIPDIRTIDLSNFSKEIGEKFNKTLAEIHNALVLHGDHFPRNMVVQDGTNKAFWIDFDRAQTYTPGDITDRHLGWFKQERDDIEWFAKAMADDCDEGKINSTQYFYYN